MTNENSNMAAFVGEKIYFLFMRFMIMMSDHSYFPTRWYDNAQLRDSPLLRHVHFISTRHWFSQHILDDWLCFPRRSCSTTVEMVNLIQYAVKLCPVSLTQNMYFRCSSETLSLRNTDILLGFRPDDSTESNVHICLLLIFTRLVPLWGRRGLSREYILRIPSES